MPSNVHVRVLFPGEACKLVIIIMLYDYEGGRGRWQNVVVLILKKRRKNLQNTLYTPTWLYLHCGPEGNSLTALFTFEFLIRYCFMYSL